MGSEKIIYEVRVAGTKWQKVSEKKFIATEKSCGFHSKFGPDSVATGGFSSGNIGGRIRYINKNRSTS